jgi:hypothetical protein
MAEPGRVRAEIVASEADEAIEIYRTLLIDRSLRQAGPPPYARCFA